MYLPQTESTPPLLIPARVRKVTSCADDRPHTAFPVVTSIELSIILTDLSSHSAGIRFCHFNIRTSLCEMGECEAGRHAFHCPVRWLILCVDALNKSLKNVFTRERHKQESLPSMHSVLTMEWICFYLTSQSYSVIGFTAVLSQVLPIVQSADATVVEFFCLRKAGSSSTHDSLKRLKHRQFRWGWAPNVAEITFTKHKTKS